MVALHILTLLTIWSGLAIAILLSNRQSRERALRRENRQLRALLDAKAAPLEMPATRRNGRRAGVAR